MNKQQLMEAFVIAFEAAEFAVSTYMPEGDKFQKAVKAVAVSTDYGVQPMLGEIAIQVEQQTPTARTLSAAYQYGMQNKRLIEDWKRSTGYQAPILR